MRAGRVADRIFRFILGTILFYQESVILTFFAFLLAFAFLLLAVFLLSTSFVVTTPTCLLGG